MLLSGVSIRLISPLSEYNTTAQITSISRVLRFAELFLHGSSVGLPYRRVGNPFGRFIDQIHVFSFFPPTSIYLLARI